MPSNSSTTDSPSTGPLSKDEILARLRSILSTLFEIPPEMVTPEAQLYDELDLDSIDAVDLVVKLQDWTGRKVKPEDFRSARTVGDIVEAVHQLVG